MQPLSLNTELISKY